MISDEFPDDSLTISSEDINETEIPEERPAEKETETHYIMTSGYCQLCNTNFAQ